MRCIRGRSRIRVREQPRFSSSGWAQSSSEWLAHRCFTGADGKAATDQGKKLGIPDYTDASFQKSKTDDQLKTAITNGVKTDKGEREGYKEKLSGEEIDNLVKLVRSFGN